jgi:poly-beta-1,6 N-acetyl-D-glucosamine synthase
LLGECEEVITFWQVVVFWIIFDIPYYLYRSSLYLGYRKGRSFKGKPFVSVLIPAYNEEVGIAKTLRSCIGQSYGNYEVIVIDDGSKDRTREIAEKFTERNWSFLVVNQRNKGKAAALNEGLKHARGEFIITIDADSELHHRALETIMNRFNSDKIGAVAGNVVGISKKSLLGYIQKIEYDIVTRFLRTSQSSLGSVIITPGAFSAYRRKALKKFEEGTLTEDFDSSLKVLEEGYDIVVAPDALCYSQVPIHFSDFVKQRVRWHRGGLEVLSKHLFHERKASVSLELSLIFFQGFYGLFPRIMILVVVPLMMMTSGVVHSIQWIAIFFAYSSIIWSINLLILKERDIKKYLAIPLFMVYWYTLVFYSILAGQINVFKEEEKWEKPERYRI